MNLKKWIRQQFRKKSRVYIFPTRMGGYLNGLIFLMFLLSLGYSNNLLLIFTIFLFAFNLLWLIQTHFHLHRLKLDSVLISSGHAGDQLGVKVFWQTAPQGPWHWQLTLESNQGEFALLNQRDEASKSEGEFAPLKRGQYQWHHLKVATSNPFGLYAAWIYYPLAQNSLVYPTLFPNVELPLSGKELEGELLEDRKGSDDFRGLSSYQGEESRKISWKHYARSGELLIKEGEEKKTPMLELELKLPQEAELKEHYLSYVATQLVECSRREIPFSLKAPGVQASYLSDSLKVLALC